MTHIALLRAVNVGGRGVVKMTDVRAAFERAGCRAVRTFIQSGNVVFDRATRGAALERRIATEMTGLLGRAPGICFRTLDELQALVAHDPFGALADDPTVKLYVAFMDRTPVAAPSFPIEIAKEAIRISGLRDRDMFVESRRKPNGMYGFPNGFVEELGVTATSRNWNTVRKLAAFAATPPPDR